MQPIENTLDKVQSDKCTIGEAIDVWKRLTIHFKNDKQVETIVKKSYEQFITKAHMLANILHPALQGRLLNVEELNTSMEFANEKYPKVSGQISSFPNI